jgi:hypothetical protein
MSSKDELVEILFNVLSGMAIMSVLGFVFLTLLTLGLIGWGIYWLCVTFL